MHYLIYLPQGVGRNSEGLQAVGLGDLLRKDEEGPRFADLTGAGPDETTGTLVGFGNAQTVYRADSQKWIPAPPDERRQLVKGRYWIGFDLASPVTPVDLARQKQIHGLPYPLGDGNPWRIPNMANLPHRYALGESGTFEDLPTIEARPLFDRMMWAYRHMVDHYSKDQEFDMDESIYYCCEMLAVNYRITPEIAGLLQLLDDSSVPTIMAATTDASSILALQEAAKKKS